MTVPPNLLAGVAEEVLGYPGPLPIEVLQGASPREYLRSYRGDFGDPVEWLAQEFTRALTADGAAAPQINAAVRAIADAKPVFAAGLVAGFLLGAKDTLTGRLKLIRDLVESIIDFYGVVYDPELWVAMLAVWRDDPGAMGQFATTLQNNHPALYQAVIGLPAIDRKLDELYEQLEQDGRVAVLRTLFMDVTEATAGLIVEQRNKILPSTDANELGLRIGRLMGRAISEAILLVLELRALLRELVELGEKIVGWSAVEQKVGQRWAATKNVAKGVNKLVDEVAEAYKVATARIEPYSRLKTKTGAFNAKLGQYLGGAEDVEQAMGGIKLTKNAYRLDAHHVAEERTFKAFAKDYEKAFGWKKPGDMHAVPIEFELHGRAGRGLAEEFKMADREFFRHRRSLTDDLEAWIGDAADKKKYPTLRSLMERYREFYKTQHSLLYKTPFEIPRPDGTFVKSTLEGWFADRFADLKAAGL